MRGHRNDLLLAAAVLALAAVVWLFFSRPGGDGAWAVVTVDGAEVGRVALVCAADVPPGVESAMALLRRGFPAG